MLSETIDQFIEYPKSIQKELKELRISGDERSRHLVLIKLAEDILTILVGICIGEYQNKSETAIEFEKVLYKNSRKHLAFGQRQEIFRSFLELPLTSIITKSLNKTYPNGSLLVSVFNNLKDKVINLGFDDEFQKHIDNLNISSNSKKNAIDIFNILINIRNIQAHPHGKAKNPLRAFPLTNEYYTFINPLIDKALYELLNHFDFFMDLYVCSEYSETENVFTFESCNNKINIAADKLELKINIGGKYYISKTDESVVNVFYEIPDLDPEVAHIVIRAVKSQNGKKILKEKIKRYLHDGMIDQMEFFSLKDEANANYIQLETLQELIEEVKKELQIKGDVYSYESKRFSEPMFLNPYWLVHFDTMKDYKVEKGQTDIQTTTGRQQLVWQDINRFLNQFIEYYLNDEYQCWVNQPNKWQQGNLSGSYWGKIVPEVSPIGSLFNIGFFIRKGSTKHAWLKKLVNDQESRVFIWINLDRNRLRNLDNYGALLEEFKHLTEEKIRKNAQQIPGIGDYLLKWDLSKSITPCLIKHYFNEEQNSQVIPCLISKLFNLNDLVSNQTATVNQLGMFAATLRNIISQVNDFALSLGIHKD